jgi:3-oxoadipate enol-lactonase
MNMTTNSARINGIDIHYRTCGEGEPLLMIMGLSANADWWHPSFLAPLAERFQVVTFDNRGAGRTTQAEGPYSIPLMVEDTLGLMDHLGWQSANVLGASMGGMIAQELALEHPERVRRLILMVTNCGGQEQVLATPEALGLLYLPREGLSDEEAARAILPLLFPQAWMDENPELVEEAVRTNTVAPMANECFMAQLNAIIAWSDHSRLSGLRHPTLVITGSEDILIPPDNSRILAEAIPDSRLVEFAGGGHGLFVQFPEKATEEILAFLA